MQMDNFTNKAGSAGEPVLPGRNITTEEARLEALSAVAVESVRFGKDFVRPLYESFCFSNIPGFIEETLLGRTSRCTLPASVHAALGQYDHVVLVFFDAFGWQSFQEFRNKSELLKVCSRDGLVLQTTSQFPSTTAVHVTSIASGLPVFEHHVCGWDYYEPRVGRMICPLKFSFADEAPRRSLVDAGFSPEQVLPEGNFASGLMAEHVTVRNYGPQAFYPSLFGNRYLPNNLQVGYTDEEQGVDALIEGLQRHTPGKSYDRIYFDQYDAVCHESSPFSVSANRTAERILSALDKLLTTKLPPRTLLMLTADHGQVATSPNGELSVNRELPNICEYLKRDAIGEPIRFSGGNRYLFLHPREEAASALLTELRRVFKGAAEVYSLPELEALGMLGPRPISPAFAERLGGIGILPYAGYSIGWLEPPVFSRPEISGHGGATAQEMETPLTFLSL
jgi:hypothetical protein